MSGISPILPQPIKSALRRLARWIVGYEELSRPLADAQHRINILEQQLNTQRQQLEMLSEELAKVVKEQAFAAMPKEASAQSLFAFDPIKQFPFKRAKHSSPEIERYLEKLSGVASGLGHVIELFLGDGLYIETLRAASKSYLGVDPSEVLIRYYQHQYRDFAECFQIYDPEKLAATSGARCDTLFVRFNRAHWSYFLLAEIWGLAAKLLSVRGKLILVLPFAENDLHDGPLAEFLGVKQIDTRQSLKVIADRSCLLEIDQESICRRSPPPNRSTIETNIGTITP